MTDAKKKKVCPMSMDTPCDHSTLVAYCIDRCAWWVPDNGGQCAIMSIAASLKVLRALEFELANCGVHNK